MALEKTFEIIRNEQEHEQNQLHQLCRLYEHYIANGVPEQDARKYIKWICRYQLTNKSVGTKEKKSL